MMKSRRLINSKSRSRSTLAQRRRCIKKNSASNICARGNVYHLLIAKDHEHDEQKSIPLYPLAEV